MHWQPPHQGRRRAKHCARSWDGNSAKQGVTWVCPRGLVAIATCGTWSGRALAEPNCAGGSDHSGVTRHMRATHSRRAVRPSVQCPAITITTPFSTSSERYQACDQWCGSSGQRGREQPQHTARRQKTKLKWDTPHRRLCDARTHDSTNSQEMQILPRTIAILTSAAAASTGSQRRQLGADAKGHAITLMPQHRSGAQYARTRPQQRVRIAYYMHRVMLLLGYKLHW